MQQIDTSIAEARWWSKQAVSDLTMYVVILGGKTCTQKWNMMDVVFFQMKIPLETARSAGFSNGFVWNARVWIGVFQLVEAPLGSEVSLYTTCISLDSCNFIYICMVFGSTVEDRYTYICIYFCTHTMS